MIYLRENRSRQALVLLKEMEHDFPENPLIRQEINRVSEKVSRSQ